MSVKILCVFYAVSVWTMIAESSAVYDFQKDVEYLYSKYNISRDVVRASATTNQSDSVFFEFEIPQRRRFYCAAIISNIVIVTLYEKNKTSKHSVSVYGIDMALVKSFRQELVSYKYEQLTVTSGPKCVYVTICTPKNQCYKFDYPWWVSSSRSDIPSGMLLGLNTCVSNAYQDFTTIFRRYIFPSMIKLHGKLPNGNQNASR